MSEDDIGVERLLKFNSMACRENIKNVHLNFANLHFFVYNLSIKEIFMIFFSPSISIFKRKLKNWLSKEKKSK